MKRQLLWFLLLWGEPLGSCAKIFQELGYTGRFGFLLLYLVGDVFRFRVVELLFVFIEERHADG